jgi:glycosyltransferase involved in cell wall biosynthesis
MKISIFTPTHNTKYIPELYQSLKHQFYTDWEWVVVPNNGADVSFLDTIVDSRVKLFPFIGETKSVGALKKWACKNATGEILLEADHDDQLTPNCLAEVAKAFEDESVGFVFSDNAKLGKFIPYNPALGWSHYPFEWKGEQLTAMNSQPVFPGRLGYIWFSPDHVRAWRKSVYDAIGGHNTELEVLDDHDLMCRTYLATRFVHIPKVLYIYRITGDNTWIERNKEIQENTHKIYKHYIYALAERFASVNNLMKIDLCGGFNRPRGYLSIDIENGDIRANLNEGIPLPDNSVGVIRAHDALEHLRDPMKTMSEIHRVLAPGGMLLSLTPSTDGRGAWQDPTHVSFWNQNSFWYYTRSSQMQYIRNSTVKFRECRLETIFPSDWHKANNIPYVMAHLEKLTPI